MDAEEIAEPRAPSPCVIDGAERQIFSESSTALHLKGGRDGDPAFLKAVDSRAIVGKSSPDDAVKENTFLIWRGGEPRGSELKVLPVPHIKLRKQQHSNSQCPRLTFPQGRQQATEPCRGTR